MWNVLTIVLLIYLFTFLSVQATEIIELKKLLQDQNAASTSESVDTVHSLQAEISEMKKSKDELKKRYLKVCEYNTMLNLKINVLTNMSHIDESVYINNFSFTTSVLIWHSSFIISPIIYYKHL